MATDPDDALERALLAEGVPFVIGCDEVGRGAIAGPVAVGVTAYSLALPPWPEGVRDSKVLSEKRRLAVAPLIEAWAPSAVGYAEAEEIDRLGITRCLGEAAKRALGELFRMGIPVAECIILLDGNKDWLGPVLETPLDIRVRVKADRDCVSVAAASVVAKVRRDNLMIEHGETYPGYGWAGNKGYGSAAHYAALAEHGATGLHRQTWLHQDA